MYQSAKELAAKGYKFGKRTVTHIIDNTTGQVVAVGTGLAILSGPALADPPVFTTLTAAVDYSTAMAAVLLVMAALAGFAILWKGGKKILQALGWS